MLEFFSGKARISRFCSRRGYSTGAFDIAYNEPVDTFSTHNGKFKKSYMDMNSDAGFLFLVLCFSFESATSSLGSLMFCSYHVVTARFA